MRGTPVHRRHLALALVVLVLLLLSCGLGEKPVQQATTDEGGVARFKDSQTGEDVVIEVFGQGRAPVAAADISFMDGDGYEGFLVTDPSASHLPSLSVFPHNSTHSISLTPAALQPHTRTRLEGQPAEDC